MFTGIIEEVGKVISVPAGKLVVSAKLALQEMALGASIAVNGVCLTVTTISGNSFSVDVMPETLRRTNLGRLSVGDRVNLERPLTLGGRLGGHLVQGHVEATGKILSVTPESDARLFKIEAPSSVMHYVVEKGFVAVDGISLTVIKRQTNAFSVSIVNYTLNNTILSDKRIGAIVNLEVDIIAKYVEQLARTGQGVTADFLKEHGFS